MLVSTSTYRVVQWATGSIGAQAIRAFAANPTFDLVGVFVTSAAKVGKDAGELAGIHRLGVAATDDVEAILALHADCIHYAPLHADADDMCRILGTGTNIVTPVGFVFPTAIGGDVCDRLEQHARPATARCTEPGSTPASPAICCR